MNEEWFRLAGGRGGWVQVGWLSSYKTHGERNWIVMHGVVQLVITWNS
jgi:hypothetical protein